MTRIIFLRECTQCDRGVLPYTNRMRYQECDCIDGYWHTYYDLTDEQLDAIERTVKILVQENEK